MKTLSKSFLHTVLVLLLICQIPALSQNYTWKNGGNVINQVSTYGTPMTFAPSHKPGARQGSAYWKDNNGKFWLFGGFGYNGTSANELNDLWKYDPAINQWAYMKGDSLGAQNGEYGTQGVTSSTSRPGARNNSASWVDAAGNFWMFGGNGYDGAGGQGYLNDLWRYDVASNQWTWVKGSNLFGQSGLYGTMGIGANANRPGAREGAVSWTDAGGNLWLFGGYGLEATGNTGELNDLWMFNIITNQWTWVRGSNSYDQNGIYGSMGTGSSLNNPGGRRYSTGWTDANGNLWLFGGYGYPATGALTGHLNDLWRYSIANNQWTWVRGSNSFDQLGIYGSLGIPSAGNNPGSRVGSEGWADGSGNLWLFGGAGMGASIQTVDYMNDLWKYNIANNTWTWVKGGNTISQAGVYGILGIPSAFNTPGGRTFLSGWIDATGTIWLFGGSGYDTNSQTSSGFLNDLWKFGNCSTQAISIIANPPTVCPGGSSVLMANGAASYSWSTSQAGNSVTVTPGANNGYTVQSVDPNGCGNTAFITVPILAAPLVSAQSSNSLACAGAPVMLTAIGANSYTWSNGMTAPAISIAASNTVYTVIGTSAGGCTMSATVNQQAVICTGLVYVDKAPLGLIITPNPSQGDFSVQSDGSAFSIVNTLGEVVLKIDQADSGQQIKTQLAKGIYYVVEGNAESKRVGKLVIE